MKPEIIEEEDGTFTLFISDNNVKFSLNCTKKELWEFMHEIMVHITYPEGRD